MLTLEIPVWRQVAVVPPLPAGGIHVWRFGLARAQALPEARAEAWLSADERERAGRFQLPADRARFRLTRNLVRWVLAGYRGLSPADLVFTYGAQGKPALAGPDSGLEFNLSHCGEFALLAVTRELPIGIDLERVRPRRQLMGIARRVFPAEICRELEALAPAVRLQRFYYHWTALEARVKARGDGVFRQLREGAGEAWRLRHWRPAPGHLAALAAQRLPPAERDWAWLEPDASVTQPMT